MLWILPAVSLPGDSFVHHGRVGDCDKSSNASQPDPSVPGPNEPSVEPTFHYGSERKAWIGDVTDALNKSNTMPAANAFM
jgi:hypothetical protein